MITREFEAAVKRVGSTDVNIAVDVILTYDPDINPLAVEAVFTISGADDERVWVFSRELLERGSKSRTRHGAGDVRFQLYPIQGVLLMCLCAPQDEEGVSTHCDIALPREEVKAFVDEMSQIDEADCTPMVDDLLNELFA